jgi:hypothetical protein
VLPDIDSVVYFQNLDDPVNTLSSLPPYTLGSHQYYELNPNRVVINITLDASKGGKIDTLRHFRFPFQADEDGFTRLEEVVVLFKDVSPLGSVLDTPTRRHGRHVVNDLLEWVACGQVKVALVNVEHVVARVLLWSDTDPSLQVIKDDIIGEYLDFYANYSAEETLDDPGLVRFMTVDEYAAEVGPELFAIETVC